MKDVRTWFNATCGIPLEASGRRGGARACAGPRPRRPAPGLAA